jgi:PAS domain S-box-containing protein
MFKKYINQIINIGTQYTDDKHFIIRIQAMNRIAFVGSLLCLSTTVIGFFINNKAFEIVGISMIFIFMISLLLTYNNRAKLAWHTIFIFPIIIFTILPLFFPSSPTVMIFFLVLQIVVLAIFNNSKILMFYFAYYGINLILFIILLFHYFPKHINLDITPSLVNAVVALILISITLRFYIQNSFVNNQILHLEEAKFKTIFEKSPIGIIITKLKTSKEEKPVNAIFLDMNAAFIEALGYTKEELDGNNIALVTHPDDLNLHIPQYGKLLADEIPFMKITKRYIHKTGKIIWGTIIVSLVRNASDTPIYSIGMLLDITEQKKQEQKINDLVEELKTVNIELEEKVNQRTADLETTNDDLQRSNQDLEQFAYAASHDLKEPLRMIGSFIQIIEKKYSDKLDDKGKEYIKYTVEGVTRMSDLINSLLQYSRVGRKESKLRKTKLNNLLELKLMDLKQVIEEKNALIDILDFPETIICEPVQMGLVFYNLINNGLKFNTNESPTITIKGEEQEEDYLFSVSDNGIGIEEKFKEQVFEIFKRLHGREKYEGTGIGLALCRKIIYRHEGDIWFESEIGEGTTFYFTIKKGLLAE